LLDCYRAFLIGSVCKDVDIEATALAFALGVGPDDSIVQVNDALGDIQTQPRAASAALQSVGIKLSNLIEET
jgi:hypothetical protein